ncbi:MAG: gliding motility-associated C-terminal domain-containing protein [Bacteroidales bacterium]|jgi:gliding motility-associated-like protein|nr:gliding motility-associated C-terminal domain-containing protein [Bacteroidales bacterium]
MKKTTPLLLLLTLAFSLNLWGTHQRAGEITYSHVGGLTYEFTIITYTYTPSLADRPEIDVYWGDGSFSTISRTVRQELPNSVNITLNKYIAQHTFPSAGNFSVTFEDPNRNAGIVNIPNSVNIPFFIETIININPFLGANSSPVLLNAPIDNGCAGVPYYHNPGAYDPDGDSLSYSLIVCRGYEGENIPGYSYPTTSGILSIDPFTGDLTWDSPITAGEYNIAILIKEWRSGILMGSVVRDMQITIAPCNNRPPEIHTIIDTCIIAGDTLSFEVIATDETSAHVTLSASGSPFLVNYKPAVFNSVTGEPPVSSFFIWITDCQHSNINPYTVLFKAKDNGPQVELSSYKTVTIRVIAPKPEGVVATPIANVIELAWDQHVCAEAKGYYIYKRRNSNPFEPGHCETGLAPERGYTLIGTNNGHDNTTFTDDGVVMPLYHGNEYCYRIVAFFENGSESIVSDEVCAYINNDAPLITRVDVESTNLAEGSIRVAWSNPSELDTMLFPGPYFEYHVLRASSENMSYELIGSTTSLQDTSYQDFYLNTQELTYFYKVELWTLLRDSLALIETSDPASSVFIEIAPRDRALTLSWSEIVPWNNERYFIYRYNPETAIFDSIGMTVSQSYTDRGLENGEEYCYYIISEGAYYLPDTLVPLHNRSQIRCGIPYDNTPPDIPDVTIATDCNVVEVEWTFPNTDSYTDVWMYYIHYKSKLTGEFTIVDSFRNDGSTCYPDPCVHTIVNAGVIIGCFALSAIDSNSNHSDLSAITCFEYDHCFNYRLPNVFTPNGDDYNDLYIPYPYSNVEKINMVIYDRWGKRIFTTENPDINWDGVNQYTKRESPDGVYYYYCDVYVQTLTGETIFNLIGSITLLRGKK